MDLPYPPNWLLWFIVAYAIFETGRIIGEVGYWLWRKWHGNQPRH